MIQKPFKFRYASEIAGAFVLLALVLLLTGIFLAAHWQGWFEGRFSLRTQELTSDEGSYGLQEGSEVRVRNTVAGKVARIMPSREGGIALTLEIRNRFKPFVRKDSVANVKMKFGVAGDAFVEIGMGKGAVVQDGDIIQCKKDEKMGEVMDMARKTLMEARDVVVPMLDQAQGILKHVNGISGSIEQGDGVAGRLVNDKAMADELNQALVNLNSGLSEARGTFHEATKLIKGAQKSWLVRGFVEQDKLEATVVPSYLGDTEIAGAIERYTDQLNGARAANDPDMLVLAACKLGSCLLARGKNKEAEDLLDEARTEKGVTGNSMARIHIAESELACAAGRPEAGIDAAKSAIKALDRSAEKELRAQCHIALARAYCACGKTDEAAPEVKEAASLLKKSDSSWKALSIELRGRVLLMKGQAEQAAAEFDKLSALLQNLELFHGMAGSLRMSGQAYEQAGRFSVAAGRYYQSGRSFFYGGNSKEAVESLARALPAADKASDSSLRSQIESLNRRIAAEKPPHM
jgi:tetratricopeptide (TPR) repeat protein